MLRLGIVISPQPCCGNSVLPSSDKWGTTAMQSSVSLTSQPTERHRIGLGEKFSIPCQFAEAP